MDEGFDTTDTDGDGLSDLCDNHVDVACPCYTLDDAVTLRADTSSACDLADPTAIPSFVFSGVVVDYGNDVNDLVGLGAAPGQPGECALGCFDYHDSSGTKCTAKGLDLLQTQSVTKAQYDACMDLTVYACL